MKNKGFFILKLVIIAFLPISVNAQTISATDVLGDLQTKVVSFCLVVSTIMAALGAIQVVSKMANGEDARRAAINWFSGIMVALIAASILIAIFN